MPQVRGKLCVFEFGASWAFKSLFKTGNKECTNTIFTAESHSSIPFLFIFLTSPSLLSHIQGVSCHQYGWQNIFLAEAKAAFKEKSVLRGFFFFFANGGFMCLSPCQVSHALNVAYGVTNLFPDQLVYKTLHILDLPETDITLYLEECSCFIDQAREQVCTHIRGVKCINNI